MMRTASIRLKVTPEQAAKLNALRTAYAEACNGLVPLVQASGLSGWLMLTFTVDHHLPGKSHPCAATLAPTSSSIKTAFVVCACKAKRPTTNPTVEARRA